MPVNRNRKIQIHTDHNRDILDELNKKTILEAIELLLDIGDHYGYDAHLSCALYDSSHIHIKYPVSESDEDYAARIAKEEAEAALESDRFQQRLGALHQRMIKQP